MYKYRWSTAVAAAAAVVTSLLAASPAQAATTARAACSSTRHPKLAATLANDINAAFVGRQSTASVGVFDPATGITCRLSGDRQFDSASAVKVTILGALLRLAQDQHRYLTSRENSLATVMITQSDNNAASALWNEVGRTRMSRFLALAGMTHTVLGPSGFWGLTQITATDELKMLGVLDGPNTVLDSASRRYELGLMHRVISSQRWGVPAGAPANRVVHVKNGWLLRSTHGWRINSIGSFSSTTSTYAIVVLSQDNPTMAYGVSTVERVARVIHRDLNSGAAAAVAPTVLSTLSERSDENIPALTNVP